MWRVTLLITLTALAGCESIRTTRALGSLQTEYGDLVRTEADCEADSKATEACLGDFPAIYASIEAEALEAIEARPTDPSPSEQQITIGLYRLAAFAALKSNSGKAAAYGGAGRDLCEAVQQRPPRDCALLELVGHYEVVNQYAADVDCLRSRAEGCRRSFAQAATEFCAKVYEPLVAATNEAKATPFLPDSVIAYLDLQPLRARESQQALAARLTKGLAFDARPRDPCRCVRLDPSDPSFDALCGNVTNEPMATFTAECVRQALDAGQGCPSP